MVQEELDKPGGQDIPGIYLGQTLNALWGVNNRKSLPAFNQGPEHSWGQRTLHVSVDDSTAQRLS